MGKKEIKKDIEIDSYLYLLPKNYKDIDIDLVIKNRHDDMKFSEIYSQIHEGDDKESIRMNYKQFLKYVKKLKLNKNVKNLIYDWQEAYISYRLVTIK